MINRFSEQWSSQPWINLWSRWLDGAVSWLLFFIKCLSFLKACLSSLSCKRWDSPFNLFIVICLWLWSAASQSSDSTEIEWETFCPRPSASVEEPFRSCSSGVAQWHKQLKTVIFQASAQVLIFVILPQKKFHVCSLSLHRKGREDK